MQEVCGFTFCEELFLCQVPRLKASNTPRSLPERAALPTVYSYTAGVAPPASACEEASVRPYPSILGWLWAGFSPYRARYVCRKEAAAQVRHTPQPLPLFSDLPSGFDVAPTFHPRDSLPSAQVIQRFNVTFIFSRKINRAAFAYNAVNRHSNSCTFG